MMNSISRLVLDDFQTLLPGVEVSIEDDKYILIRDLGAGTEDIYEYSAVANEPGLKPDIYIRAGGPNFERYSDFWRRRLNFQKIGTRIRQQLVEKLEGTKVVKSKLVKRAFTDAKEEPLSNIRELLNSSPSGRELELLFVSADGGRGKSTMLRQFVVEELTSGEGRLYVFVDIHGKSFASLSEHIALELDRSAPWITFDGFLRLLSIGLIRLVLDGFDELGVELGEDIVFERLQDFLAEALKLRSSYGKSIAIGRRVVVVLSGRTQYFSNVNLKQKLSRLVEGASTWIEFQPWSPELAVKFVRDNLSTLIPSPEYLLSLEAALSKIESEQSRLYGIVVHPVVLRVLAEAEVSFESVGFSAASGAEPAIRGLVSLLSHGIEALMLREERKHISASGVSLFPINIQRQILELVCAEVIKHNEDPLAFDPFYVEWSATLVAQNEALDQDAQRRLAGAAPQHVLFGLGGSAKSKTLGFLHQTIFDVIGGWVVSERIKSSDSVAASAILQVKYLSDEMLASAALRLQRAVHSMTRTADITQELLQSRRDPTVAWNLAKLCFERRLVAGRPAIPSSGKWSVSGATFVQISFDPLAMEGATFSRCEFSLCELSLPTNEPARFEQCAWSQCSFSFEVDSKAVIVRDCRATMLVPVLYGRECEIVSNLEDLGELLVDQFKGVSFVQPPQKQRQLTDRQKTIVRFVKELRRNQKVKIEQVRNRMQIDERLVWELVGRLKQLGYIREHGGPHSGKESYYQVVGDIDAGVEQLFEHGEF
ncbi:hypothetical protein [Cystobacter fuscus]|uniref:hypothetical protein n=1 Tax=Cystobacter fuscus TaxID=43 RepID=UPI002B2B8916|nr:hypothetical protein F0U63_29040 [Cystobacter fuscus]